MGKFSPAHVDNVLTWKLKTLIQGTIERQMLECAPKSEDVDSIEPTITYENFVEELSVRDSFTATIMELLVKEIADRRTRLLPNDRALISDATRKTLRRLAAHYPERRNTRHSPRSLHLSQFLNQHTMEYNELEEDATEFQNMVDDHTTENAQFDSNLYGEFSSPERTWTTNQVNPLPPMFSTSRDASPSFLPPPRSPPTSTRPDSSSWPPHPAITIASGSSSLHRQPSLRRPNRPSARTSDFREFTLRRRSSGRLMNDVDEDRRDRDSQTDATPAFNARRFFSSGVSGPSSSPSVARPEIYSEALSHSLPTPSASSPSSSSPDFTEDNVNTVMPPHPPRLRRGGIRAPESLLSRHASPVVVSVSSSSGTPIPTSNAP